MLHAIKESLWKQFGASIDMLKHAIERCPEDHWGEGKKLFYHAYHCLLFLDYYLNLPAKAMTCPLPFRLAKPGEDLGDSIDDLVPNRVYSKQEILDYLQTCRDKCYNIITGLTEESMNARWKEIYSDRDYRFLELLMYNMRHVQHHAAQMNLLLRQGIDDAPKWVSRAREDV